MDIVITLPKVLWLKIVSGDKLVEMRKWDLPSHFNPKTDCIYVVLKGTRRVAGFFKVVSVSGRIRKEAAWLEFGRGLGVSYEWFSKYWGKDEKRFMYFFVIGDCHVSDPHFLIEVAHAPQKYINVNKRIKYGFTGYYLL